jgi:hypothetical protein
MALMNGSLFVAALAVMVPLGIYGPYPAQSPRSEQTQTLQSEVVISTLSIEDLKKQLAAPGGKVEDKSEVSRAEPVTVIVRATGCMKDEAGQCDINANVTVYKPDGSIFLEAKVLDLSTGRVSVPLDIDATAAMGLYKVVVNVRDLTGRRFAVVERRFAVK